MARGGAGPAEAPLGREHTAPSRCRRAARDHVTRLFRQRPGVHRAAPPQRRPRQSAPARAQAVTRPTIERRRAEGQRQRRDMRAAAIFSAGGRCGAVTRPGAPPCPGQELLSGPGRLDVVESLWKASGCGWHGATAKEANSSVLGSLMLRRKMSQCCWA